MARTQKEIYNAMAASKETNADLNSLLPNPATWDSLFTLDNFKLLANTIIKGLSASKVAMWQLMYFVFSCALFTIEEMIDVFTEDVDEMTTNREYAQLPWIIQKVKDYQHSDSLTWLEDSYYGYATIDTTKQIITQSAAAVANGQLIVKAAKGVSGSRTKLSAGELLGLGYYLKGTQAAFAEDGILPPNTPVVIISEDPDTLKMALNVFYDPDILASDGESIADPGTYPVKEAIIDFIQSLPYNSRFRVIDLIEAVMAAAGVTNVVVIHCDATQGALAYTDVLLDSGHEYLTYAGYMEMDAAHDLDGYYDDLNTIKTLTYISE